MSPQDKHEDELKQAQWLVSHCPKCKCQPKLQYEPGVTFAECKCRRHVMPDEEYLELARAINVVHEPRLKHYQFAPCNSRRAS